MKDRKIRIVNPTIFFSTIYITIIILLLIGFYFYHTNKINKVLNILKNQYELKIEEKDNELEGKTIIIEQKENTLEEKNELINQLENKKKELESTTENLNKEIEKLKQEIEQLKVAKATTSRSSDSTRITNTYNTNEGEWIKFTATYYCPCNICSEGWSRKTASGATATAGRTIAMPSNYTFGTKILMKDSNGNLLNNGQPYIVEDRGGAIKNSRVDIFVNSHSEALKLGRRTVYLQIIK